MAPSRDDFNAVIEDNDIDLLTHIKCELSPSFKKKYKKKEKEENFKKTYNMRIENGHQIISFGSYPFEADGEKKPIEWRILCRDGNRMLLITQYGIDAIPFNKECIQITWEKCTLRKYLNGAFFNNSFNDNEKKGIISTMIKADAAIASVWYPGADTEDKIFLLSIPECKKYLKSEKDRTIKPTPYVTQVKNVCANNSDGISWWLRSISYQCKNASVVYSEGIESSFGLKINSDDICIRPALWLDISKL